MPVAREVLCQPGHARALTPLPQVLDPGLRRQPRHQPGTLQPGVPVQHSHAGHHGGADPAAAAPHPEVASCADAAGPQPSPWPALGLGLLLLCFGHLPACSPLLLQHYYLLPR